MLPLVFFKDMALSLLFGGMAALIVVSGMRGCDHTYHSIVRIALIEDIRCSDTGDDEQGDKQNGYRSARVCR